MVFGEQSLLWLREGQRLLLPLGRAWPGHCSCPRGWEVRGAPWAGGTGQRASGTRGWSHNALSSGGQCGVSLYPKATGQPLEKNKTKT